MEKNIVEGDGVDAVIWAGKIGELITHYISSFVDLDLKELEQKKKLVILFNRELIPEYIYDQLDSIRQYRNIATHHDLNNELHIAMKVHKMTFNIVRWFYGVYKDDDSIFKIKYPGVTYRHDESFIKKLRDNTSLNIVDSHDIPLSKLNADYNIHKFFNQNNVYFNEDLGNYTAYIMDGDKKITIGHFKTKEVAVRKGYQFVQGDDFKLYMNFHIKPEKLENGQYSDRKGIDYDEEEELWTATFNKKDLGYFISQNSAIIARKEYIDTLPLPKPKNGSYSDYKEITFDLNHKLWCIKRDGEIYDYYDSEEEAIYNLIEVLNINIPLEKLGIVENEEDSRWRIYYKNKYVATCDSENEAIRKRLDYVSSFAQPKRNKDGEFSIHKGIFYDEKNLIWVLRIKGELLGFFDSEEDAFNFKKEFLESKGFDVSDLVFHEEESFDESFDFKVRINSDDNAIVYNEESGEWIVHFRGNEIGRFNNELDAKRSRINYLKSMPYPPRKSNNKYSLFEGIDYDIDHHLWTARYEEESIGYFDSEEDAFYALKEYMVNEGQDVSDMHFNENDGLSSTGVDTSLDDSSEDDETRETKFISYYDVFKSKDEADLNGAGEDDSEVSTIDFEMDKEDISQERLEEFRKIPFYGIGKKANGSNDVEDVSIYDLDSDDDEDDFIDELDVENVDSEVSERFSKQNRNLSYPRRDSKGAYFNNLRYGKDYKEIRFNSHDFNNFRREIVLAYNDEELFVSLEGMISGDELKNILSNDYFNNTDQLNYKREDDDLFSIFINLRYDLASIDLNGLLKAFSDFGWNFDLLSSLSGNDERFSILSSNGKSKLLKKDDYDESNDEIISRPKDYLNKGMPSRKKVYSKQEDLISSKEKRSSCKTGKAIIRGGERVSLEEAELLDNAKEEKEIKSRIIDKRPERTKEFRTSTLGDVLELHRVQEAKEEDYESESMDDVELDSVEEEGSGSIFDLDDSLEGHLIDEQIMDSFGSSDLNDFDEESFEDDFDYGDMSYESGSSEGLSFEDMFDDENDGLSFEEELENYDVSASDDLDEEPVIADDSNEDLTSEIRTEKIKKPKKAKKEKRIPEDAFDDRYKNAYEIEHDEENDKWIAYIGGELLKSYDTPKEAVFERKKALRRKISLPRKGLNGKYTNEEGIDFNLKERIWTVSINGIIICFAVNEKEAVLKREIFDLILNKLDIEKDEFDEEKFEEIKATDFSSILKELSDDDLDDSELSPSDIEKSSKKFNFV